jgi:hypothetical protein
VERMKREFDYNNLSILDIESNKHLIFVCDADSRKVIVKSDDYEKNI